MENSEIKAKKYARTKFRLGIVNFGISLGLLIFLLFSGVSEYLRDFVIELSANPWLFTALYITILGLATEIITLPVDFYSGYIIEHRYDLSTENISGWIKDELKGLLINGILGIALLELIYFLLRNYIHWWFIASLAIIGFVIILANLAPVILLPIFFKFKPLEDNDLKDRLSSLARKVGIKIIGVFEMDLSRKTKAANAALAGWGNTRRIILADTLLSNFQPDEIEVVLAHELAHHKFHHFWKGIFIQSIVTVTGLYLTNLILLNTVPLLGYKRIDDIAAFPLLALSIMAITLIAMPVANYISRKMEFNSDRFAVSITEKTDSFVSVMEKLARQNLIEFEPHPLKEFLLMSHPSIKKRIENIRGLT